MTVRPKAGLQSSWRRWFLRSSLPVLLTIASAGCAASSKQSHVPSGGKHVRDEDFAEAVTRLLRDPTPSPERQALLAGTVERQLAHAVRRFRAHQKQRGLTSVLGALYLLRLGELRPGMFGAEGLHALSLATDMVAAVGDEGKSIALLNLRRAASSLAKAARFDGEEHRKALFQWIQNNSEKPGLSSAELAGMNQVRSTSRALLEVNPEALQDARKNLATWVDSGLAFQAQFRADIHSRPKREEAMEGYRAVTSAAATLTALFLRYGDAEGALDALLESRVDRVASPPLFERLQAVVRRGQAEDWRGLLELYSRSVPRDEESTIDRELLRAAVFNLAIEAYRRDPTAVDIADALALSLVGLGMPEAAPVVLLPAVRAHPEPRLVSHALELVNRVLLWEQQGDDLASAHRVFQASLPLLALADQPALRGKIHPSTSQVRWLAAGMEVHYGDLDAARTLLETVVRQEPSAASHRLLAAVERQQGYGARAVARLAAVSKFSEAQSDAALSADAHLLRADILREQGDREPAYRALVDALKAVLQARSVAKGNALAKTERLLARILERFGEPRAAARAVERGLSAAQGDDAQTSLLLLESVARAYVGHDVEAAQHLVHKAIAQHLSDEARVYLGLWLQALEQETHVRTDGAAREILTTVPLSPAWSGRLAAWATQRISIDELAQAALTPQQRTEALFYRALAARAQGNVKLTERLLREVISAPVVDLFELQIARDLLAGATRRLGSLPKDVVLP